MGQIGLDPASTFTYSQQSTNKDFKLIGKSTAKTAIVSPFYATAEAVFNGYALV